MPKKNRKQRKKVRQALWNNQPHCCEYCGVSLEYEEMTLDHMIPYSKGGKLKVENTAMSCFHCNNLKRDMDVASFKELLQMSLKTIISNRYLTERQIRNLVTQ